MSENGGLGSRPVGGGGAEWGHTVNEGSRGVSERGAGDRRAAQIKVGQSDRPPDPDFGSGPKRLGVAGPENTFDAARIPLVHER